MNTIMNMINYVLEDPWLFGWPLVAGTATGVYLAHRTLPTLKRWMGLPVDPDYHKDPVKALARMDAIQRARELQQSRLLEASERAQILQKEREEQKRQENLKRLEKYGAQAAGRRLGTADDDFLPLSGGASTSSYRAPKRSACKGGGCGR